MARSKRTLVVIVPLKFWLIPGRDDDIIRFLETVAPRQRASAVLRAMRGGLSNQPQPISEQAETDALLDHLGELWS